MKIWTRWLILGVASVLFGGIVLANPVAASISVTILAGILFTLAGLSQLVAWVGARGAPSRRAGIALGAVMVVLGLVLIFNPLGAVMSLTLVITVLLAAAGIARLGAAYRMQQTAFFWPMVLSGGLSVLLAGYITANFFDVAPRLLGILLGIELLFNGAGLIVLGLFLKSLHDRLDD